MCEILLKLKNDFCRQNILFIALQFFLDTDRQVATVAMETAQLVLSQF